MPDALLYCGDSTAILPTLADASVDCVITDPPYPEIDRDYGRMTEAAWHAMMDVVVPECRRVLKPTGSAVFVLQPNSERVGRMRPWLWEFMAKWTREWGMVQDAWWWNTAAMPEAHSIQGRLLRPSVKACVWLGPDNAYRDQDAVLWEESQHNVALRASRRICNFKNPSGHHQNTATMGAAAERRGGVNPFNCLPVPNTNSRTSGGASGHGASTPAFLADWWLRYICPPGGTVLDPFVGSGTVALAALKRGCNAVGIERMPKYHATAEQRVAAAKADREAQLIPAQPKHARALGAARAASPSPIPSALGRAGPVALH
jgi:DNA modification methylase